MSDTGTMPAALSRSREILRDVRRAEAQLRTAFHAGCLDSQGLLAQPDRCSDALTDAIRALLDAQTRLAGTDWPQQAYQPVHPAESEAAE